jgi:hypothetical protein
MNARVAPQRERMEVPALRMMLTPVNAAAHGSTML